MPARNQVMTAFEDRDRDREQAAERLKELFERHHAAVHAYVRRRSTRPEAVDDIVAETFLVAWRRLEKVPIDSLPWLLAVARNVLATQRRSVRRQLALVERLGWVRQETVGPPDALTSAEPIAEALAVLSEKDREAITLVAWDGLSPAEAARVVGQSSSSFRVRLHRAKRRLQRELDRGAPSATEMRAHLSAVAKEALHD
jgi:RNA polymerase sigma-70 factor, ECF subfamily